MVTGATGFIGSRVVQKLLQNETAVKILALPGEAVPAAWAEKIEIVRGSISDPRAVEKAANGAKTIIHLVAIVTDWGDEKEYWEFTVEGSRFVAGCDSARVKCAINDFPKAFDCVKLSLIIPPPGDKNPLF